MKTFDRWSWSQLSTYETCPLQAKFKYIDRIPEPPNKHALRGDEIHKALENAVNGKGDIPPEAEHFRKDIEAAREWPAEHRLTEVKEMFDREWQPTTDKNKQWFVVKSDLKLRVGNTSIVVDYKTGKKFGNEVKHFRQKRLYGISEMLINPNLEKAICEIWYIDQKEVWSTTFSRNTLQMGLKQFKDSVDIMMNDTLFRPRPNAVNCKYCPYSPRNNGHCPVGV